MSKVLGVGGEGEFWMVMNKDETPYDYVNQDQLQRLSADNENGKYDLLPSDYDYVVTNNLINHLVEILDITKEFAVAAGLASFRLLCVILKPEIKPPVKVDINHYRHRIYSKKT